MRISDWSSDVCSSDLHCDGGSDGGDGFIKWNETNGSAFDSRSRCTSLFSPRLERGTDRPNRLPKLNLLDRKSGAWGKGVSVRVDVGGRRSIKKKKKVHDRIMMRQKEYVQYTTI